MTKNEDLKACRDAFQEWYIDIPRGKLSYENAFKAGYETALQSTRKPPASDKCGNCGGDGWYTWGHPDMPEQKQCEECCGTGTMPVDTIAVPREVLQGVRDEAQAIIDGALFPRNFANKILSSLDAVLSEGE